jgi:hypothetical protein
MFHIFMVAWWGLFSIVIVPGHTRGSIPLATKVEACPFCSPLPACCQTDVPSPGKPSKSPSENCSICYLVAGLTTTPIVAVFTMSFTLVARSTAVVVAIPILDEAPLSILCRGPPAS